MRFWNHKDLWFTLILGSIIMFSTWWSAKNLRPVMPTQTDIQTTLVQAGYDIGPKGIDGIIGKDSRLAWDDYTIKVMYDDNSRSTK